MASYIFKTTATMKEYNRRNGGLILTLFGKFGLNLKTLKPLYNGIGKL